MTSVKFEAGVIVDAVRKTARIAPTKGSSPSAGLVFDLYPGKDVQCVARASNHAVSYAEIISPLEITGDDVRWRLPSSSMSAVIGNLPLRGAKPVELTQDGNRIKIVHGRLNATVALMDNDTYPDWGPSGDPTMTPVAGLPEKLALVEWAASKDTPPLTGVYADGNYLVGTDSYKLVRVPCELDIPHPIIIPAGILGGILKSTGEISLGVSDKKLIVHPDEYIEVQSVLYDGKFPPLAKITRTDYDTEVVLPKDIFLDKMNRAYDFAASDSTYPMLRIVFGNEEVTVGLENEEIGGLNDTFDIIGQAVHDEQEFHFTPRYIIDTVKQAPGDSIRIKYDNPAKGIRSVLFEADQGFQCWVFPRKRR